MSIIFSVAADKWNGLCVEIRGRNIHKFKAKLNEGKYGNVDDTNLAQMVYITSGQYS